MMLSIFICTFTIITLAAPNIDSTAMKIQYGQLPSSYPSNSFDLPPVAAQADQRTDRQDAPVTPPLPYPTAAPQIDILPSTEFEAAAATSTPTAVAINTSSSSRSSSQTVAAAIQTMRAQATTRKQNPKRQACLIKPKYRIQRIKGNVVSIAAVEEGLKPRHAGSEIKFNIKCGGLRSKPINCPSTVGRY